MKKYIYLLLIVFVVVSCYESDDQYTQLENIEVNLTDSDALYADSVTAHLVEVRLPGLRFDKDLSVTLTTDWGYWSNQKRTITVNAAYDATLDYFKISETLYPGRDVKVFAVQVASSYNNLTKSFSFNSVARWPNLVQIGAESLSLVRKAGTTTKVNAYFYSDIGYPSTGFNFSFQANDNVLFVPLRRAINGSSTSSQLMLTQDTSTEMLVVTGTIQGHDGIVIQSLKIALVKPQ